MERRQMKKYPASQSLLGFSQPEGALELGLSFRADLDLGKESGLHSP